LLIEDIFFKQQLLEHQGRGEIGPANSHDGIGVALERDSFRNGLSGGALRRIALAHPSPELSTNRIESI
jgi:hypothetical protein